MSATQTRQRGRKIAAGLVAMLALVVAIIVFNRPGPSSPSGFPSGAEAPEPITNTQPISTAQDVRVEVVDSTDGTLRALLTAARMEPIGSGDHKVTQPRVWHYLQDGQTVFVRSDSATVHIPGGQESPEHGTLLGNVQVRWFDPVGVNETVDVDRDRPVMTASFESLRFDATLGEASTNGPLQFLGDEFEVRGVGLEALIDLADESLNSLRITQGRFARYVPMDPLLKANANRRTSVRTPPAPGPASPTIQNRPANEIEEPRNTPPAVAAVVETRLYRIDFLENVTFSRGAHIATADRLSLWARTLDDRLPEGAVPQMKGLIEHSSLNGVGRGAGIAPALTAIVASMALAQQAGQQAQPDELIPAELRWTGPMTVTPLDETPEQLAGGNHVSVRFESNAPGLVEFSDQATGSTARCGWIEYAATTQIARLGGKGNEPVRLFSPDAVHGDSLARLDEVEVDLAAGTFLIRGGGFAENTAEGHSLEWVTEASGDLVVKNGTVVGLERAVFEGAVKVSSSEGWARADALIATFDPVAGGFTLRRTEFEGRSLASGKNGESLESDFMEIVFKPGPVQDGKAAPPTPTLLTARGGVVARQPDSIAQSELLVAELETQDKKVVVTRLEMEGGVTFEREDEQSGRSTAAAGRLVAHPEAKSVELLGEGASPARVTHNGSSIWGEQILLDELDRKVRVFGPGHLNHDMGDVPFDRDPALRVAWTIEMILDDGEGLIDSRGEVRADFTPDPLSHDSIEAHRLWILMQPAAVEARIAESEENPVAWEQFQDRIQKFEAFGSVLYEEGGVDAIVRSRRYAATEDGHGTGPLVKAMNLSGARIIGDHTSDEFSVPGPGRLLVMDESEPDASAAANAESSAETDMRGAALFDWSGSLSANRTTGKFEMTKSVRVSHKRSVDGVTMYLECDQITGAAAVEDEGEGLGTGRLGDLQHAQATGNIYARWQGRELLADRLLYNALIGTIRAEADEDSRLTVVESARAAVFHAKAATWTVESGDAQLEGIEPIVVPIGKIDGK